MISQGIFFSLAAYLFGSIPFGKLIARRVASIDITKRGSQNIGATNVARELGDLWGLITLFLDMLKGYIPITLYATYVSQTTAFYSIGLSSVMLSALIGHQFSLFLKFEGGKGVGTATGVYLALSPLPCLLAAVLFVLIVYKWDYISLGSMASASAMPLLLALFDKEHPLILCSALIAALIILKHRENIKRMLKGEERKWRERHSHASRSRSRSNSSSE
jgi:glycerol-3-phosphate acyltransferase PlsY